MSDRERQLLAKLEADPDVRAFVPFLRVIFGVPDGRRGALLHFADLWNGLNGIQRSLLVLTVYQDLEVGQVARLAGVHRCTLSRNASFKSLRKLLRSGRLSALPRGYKSADGDIESFDDDSPHA